MPFQLACTGVSGGIQKPFKTKKKNLLNQTSQLFKCSPFNSRTVACYDVGFSKMTYGCKPLQVLIEFLPLNYTVGFQIPPLC